MENAPSDTEHLGNTGSVKKAALVRVGAARGISSTHAKASLVMPNGIQLKWQRALDGGFIRELITAAGEL